MILRVHALIAFIKGHRLVEWPSSSRIFKITWAIAQEWTIYSWIIIYTVVGAHLWTSWRYYGFVGIVYLCLLSRVLPCEGNSIFFNEVLWADNSTIFYFALFVGLGSFRIQLIINSVLSDHKSQINLEEGGEYCPAENGLWKVSCTYIGRDELKKVYDTNSYVCC